MLPHLSGERSKNNGQSIESTNSQSNRQLSQHTASTVELLGTMSAAQCNSMHTKLFRVDASTVGQQSHLEWCDTPSQHNLSVNVRSAICPLNWEIRPFRHKINAVCVSFSAGTTRTHLCRSICRPQVDTNLRALLAVCVCVRLAAALCSQSSISGLSNI